MQRKKLGVDVILDVLQETLAAQPEATFVKSLLQQYQERGGLSKKQLQGLRGKASRISTINPAKLATLDAIILKKPTREKSAPISLPNNDQPNQAAYIQIIDSILEKYPAHKRVLFYQSKCNSRETLTPADKAELERFKKLLLD